MNTKICLASGAVAAFACAVPAAAQFDFGAGVDFPVFERPSEVAVADLDNDGALDFAVTSDSPDKVSIFFGDGDGGFSAPLHLPVGAGRGPRSIVAVDLENNGRADLVVAVKNIDRVLVIRNDGNRNFTFTGLFEIGEDARHIAVGDLNGDGLPDLVVSNRDSNDVSILINNGAGGFGPTVSMPVGEEPRGSALADLNGNGALDLVVANHRDRNISVFFGDGAGGFGGRVDYPVGAQVRPRDVVAADLSGNGHMDIAVATSGTGLNFAAVFINDGAGALSGPTNYPVGGVAPRAIRAVDLDLDGGLDLVTANRDSNNVSLLPNLGGGVFGQATLLGVGAEPEHLAVGDFDANGGPDLVVVNETSDTVTVLLNNLGDPGCPPDWNGDGVVDSDDLFDFLADWAAGSADYNGDGVTDSDDLFEFLSDWAQGC